MTGRNDGRGERLKAALRDNLRRRKAQERARDAPPEPATETAAEADRTPNAGAAPDSGKTRL